MAGDLKEHVTASSTWMRLLYMILFVVAFNVAELVIAFVVLVQFLFQLMSGRPLEQLIVLGDSLGSYVGEIVRFLSFRSEGMPYPFGKWPKGTTGFKSAPRRRPPRRSTRSSTQSRRTITATATDDGAQAVAGDS